MEKQILVMKHLKCSYFSNSEANNPFKEKEQQAIVNFVKRGVVSYLFQTTTMQIEI